MCTMEVGTVSSSMDRALIFSYRDKYTMGYCTVVRRMGLELTSTIMDRVITQATGKMIWSQGAVYYTLLTSIMRVSGLKEPNMEMDIIRITILEPFILANFDRESDAGKVGWFMPMEVYMQVYFKTIFPMELGCFSTWIRTSIMESFRWVRKKAVVSISTVKALFSRAFGGMIPKFKDNSLFLMGMFSMELLTTISDLTAHMFIKMEMSTMEAGLTT